MAREEEEEEEVVVVEEVAAVAAAAVVGPGLGAPPWHAAQSSRSSTRRLARSIR
jgi:hypothetical protein